MSDSENSKNNQAPPVAAPATVQAYQKRQRAAYERKAASYGTPESGDCLTEALQLEAEAAALLQVTGAPTIRSGEVLRMPEDPDNPPWEIQNTLRDPDQAALDASVVRTDLLFETHHKLLPLAIDTAESVRAGNSLEKMLAHQLAALHLLMMNCTRRAIQFERMISTHETLPQSASIELGRLTNSVARLSLTYQEGLSTLTRMKNGTQQTVIVKHVTVAAGGQAVIGAVRGAGVGKDTPTPCEQK